MTCTTCGLYCVNKGILMTISVFDQIVSARNRVFEETQLVSSPVMLTVAQVDSLISSLRSQEAELKESEDSLSLLTSSVEELKEQLSCNDFQAVTPDDDAQGDLFEVFVGTDPLDCGRLFAYWDSDMGSFYTISEGDNGEDVVMEVDDVMFWRAILPEPYEELEIEGL